jgi:hypothetical protein
MAGVRQAFFTVDDSGQAWYDDWYGAFEVVQEMRWMLQSEADGKPPA